MLKFLRIICIWICCVSCLFGRITLPTVAAVPFEYFEDHEQLSYDLDTEQSKAKYDTRLLSEQLLKEQKTSTSQNYGEQRENFSSEEIVDDLQPHERAASCYKSGHKYTHGQKVPRLDPCEVCLCMDGEIFCWWEKCAKKRPKFKLPKNSNVNQHPSMLKFHKIRMQATDRPLQRGEQEQQQHLTNKVDAADATEFDNVQQMQYEQNFLKIKQKQKQHANKMSKKKIYQEEQQHPQQHHQQKSGEYKLQLSDQHQQHVHKHLHGNEHEHEHTASSSSKILNFPENLPSVLYHDYKTEEHQHHQHQHHQQHLKHQLQQHQIQQQQQQQLQKLHQQELQHEQHSAQITTTIEAAMALAAVGETTTIITTTTLATPLSSSYLSTGNDNNYDEIETDSDILPEPPTKKPKVTASTITKNMITTEKSTTAAAAIATSLVMTTKNNGSSSGSSDKNNYNAAGVHEKNESDNENNNDGKKSNTHNNNDMNQNPLKVGVAAVGASDDVATRVAMKNKQKGNNPSNNKNIKDDAEEDDDAFHRWLTSTETNNNKNDSDTGSNSNNQNNEKENFDIAQSADLDMPIGAQEDEKQEQTTIMTTTNKNNNKIVNVGIHPQHHQQDVHHTHTHTHTQNDGDVYFRSSYNDYSSEFNGTVVNIDILLTTADENQQQQQQQKQLHQHQHEHEHEQHQQQHEDQIQQESIILEADLISNTNKIDLKATKTEASAIFTSSPAGALSAATANDASSLVPTSTLSPDKQCNVMGTLYKIGDVLPQDTGNCLQCICIDGSTSDDTPRVTCSPHNCPPLVLPDLFDATGY